MGLMTLMKRHIQLFVNWQSILPLAGNLLNALPNVEVKSGTVTNIWNLKQGIVITEWGFSNYTIMNVSL